MKSLFKGVISHAFNFRSNKSNFEFFNDSKSLNIPVKFTSQTYKYILKSNLLRYYVVIIWGRG